MKLLLWADHSKTTEEFLKKLRREHFEVYVVYDDQGRAENTINKTYEEYHIKYESKYILTMLRNISPDVCFFMIDPFREIEKNDTYIHYISSLTNAVLSARSAKVKYFLYRSSTKIFDDNDEEEISENTIVTSRRDHINKLKSCENIIFDNATNSFQTITIYLAEIYNNQVQSDNIDAFGRFMYAIHRKNGVYFDENKYCDCLYIKDMCEALYRILINLKSAPQKIIIGPENSVKEKDIIDILQKNYEFNSETVLETYQSSYSHAYKNEFLRSLGYKQYFSAEKGICDAIKNIEFVDEMGNRIKKARNKWISYIEIFGAFAGVQVLASLTSDYNYHNIIDLYTIFVLAVAVTYGGVKAGLSILLCLVGRIMFGTKNLVLHGVEYYYWILQLLIAATLGGFVKDKYKRKFADLEDEKECLHFELAYYKDLNENSQQIKDIYEEKLLNYENSYAKIAEIVSNIDSLEPQKLFFESVKAIERFLDSKGVCIYSYNEDRETARLLASSQGKIWGLGKSFWKDSCSEMMEIIQKDEVFMNKMMDSKLPLMAKALKSKGKIKAIIMIYHLKFEDWGISQRNRFLIITRMIEKSMNRAFEYYDDVREKKYNDQNIMRWSAFEKLMDMYCGGEFENLLKYGLFEVIAQEQEREIVSRLIRETDYIAEKEHNHFYILLTNIETHEIEIVIQRFKEKGLELKLCAKKKGKEFKEVFPDLS